MKNWKRCQTFPYGFLSASEVFTNILKMYEPIFLSSLKLINFWGVDSQLWHVERGIIQSSSVVLRGEFLCHHKLFTVLCNSSYIVDPRWVSLNLSQTHRTPTGKTWHHAPAVWNLNMRQQSIPVLKKKKETKHEWSGKKRLMCFWVLHFLPQISWSFFYVSFKVPDWADNRCEVKASLWLS